MIVQINTVKSGKEYRALIRDHEGDDAASYLFSLVNEEYVQIMTRNGNLGLFHLARFGGNLNPGSVRFFLHNEWGTEVD